MNVTTNGPATMYFWNTTALANDLREGVLSEREHMKYYLLWTGLVALALELPIHAPEPVTAALIAASTVGVVGTTLGVYVTYLANHAGDDRDFIARSICLGLPVGIRLACVFLPLYLVYFIVGASVGGSSFDTSAQYTTWVDVLFYATFQIAFYWRLRRHIGWISQSRHGEA